MKYSWLENAVFYEIYPTSFKDSDGDGIGDLPGIIEKLDYVADLGCNGIWLNPCFESPFLDGGYDITDYRKVDPRFGTNEDLCCFFEEAKKRGIRVLLDLVMGHTSDQHPWFRQSCLEEKNQYTDAYIWSDHMDVEHCEGRFMCGRSERPHMYKVNYYATQPALNYGYYKPKKSWQMGMNDPAPLESRRRLIGVCKYWLALGASGFRVDMAHAMVKGDTPLSAGNIAFWNDVIPRIKEEYPEAVFLSEWNDPMKTIVKSSFDMDFYGGWGFYKLGNYDRDDPEVYGKTYFSKKSRGVFDFLLPYQLFLKPVLKKGYPVLSLGNHDTIRMSRGRSDAMIKAVLAAHFTLPHVPLLYYGEEIGMPYQPLKSKDGGYHRTGARTPMQWDNTKNMGFSEAIGELYLPVEPDSNSVHTVAAQAKAPESILKTAKQLIHWKRTLRCLQVDSPFHVLCYHGNPLVYRRRSDRDEVLVVLLPRAEERAVPLHKYLKGKKYQSLLGNAVLEGETLHSQGEAFAVFVRTL